MKIFGHLESTTPLARLMEFADTLRSPKAFEGCEYDDPTAARFQQAIAGEAIGEALKAMRTP